MTLPVGYRGVSAPHTCPWRLSADMCMWERISAFCAFRRQPFALDCPAVTTLARRHVRLTLSVLAGDVTGSGPLPRSERAEASRVALIGRML